MLAIKEATRTATLRQLQSETPDTSTGPTFEDLAHGIRQTKPSSIKAVTVEIPQVQWSDIGGMEDVKDEIRMKIIHPLANPELFRNSVLSRASARTSLVHLSCLLAG